MLDVGCWTLDVRHRRFLHGLKRPVPRPVRALLDPAPKRLDLRRLERLVLLRRRHHFVLVGRSHTPEQLALLKIAGHDGNLTGLCFAKSRLLLVESQTCLPFIGIRPVTREAVIRKKRANLLRKINRRRTANQRCSGKRERNQIMTSQHTNGSSTMHFGAESYTLFAGLARCAQTESLQLMCLEHPGAGSHTLLALRPSFY